MGMATSARHHDDLLIEEMSAPPPLADARDALEYWLRRRDTLPLHRVRARREAREMALRWEERVRRAEIAEGARSLWRQVLDAVGVRPPSRATLPAPRSVALTIGAGVMAVTALLMATALVLLVVAYEIVAHLV